MNPRDVVQEILDQNGTWMVSQIGRDGLHDLIWDVYSGYQRMSVDDQDRFRARVEAVIFG